MPAPVPPCRLYVIEYSSSFTYDATATYEEGNYVQYQGGIYKANTDIDTAEAWDATHWDAVVLTTEMKDPAVDLTDFVKVDLTNGSGISTNQYAHLTVVS